MSKPDVNNSIHRPSGTNGTYDPERVSFTEMKNGTKEDFELIRKNDLATAQTLPDKILGHLQLLAEDDGAYQISRLDHCL